MDASTIAAISTPLGTGGIGIVRVSGPQALAVAERLFRPRGNKPMREAKGYTGMLGRIFDESGDVDDAIAFVYRAPASYTGEDVVELSCHGGVWAVQKLLRLCLEHGAQPAAPGEFTKRAFLNGKLALSDAESVIDLISAQSDSAMRAALSAKDGSLSTAVQRIVESLLEQAAHLAAWADYPDEEIEGVEEAALSQALEHCETEIAQLLATYDCGRILREGVETVIVGRPNVGKSTLMNLLAGRERSIVTEIPGTTRDVVEDQVRLGDCVLNLADTAGIRDTEDLVENIGVRRAKERIETAGLILAVFDSSDELGEEDRQLLDLLADRPCIAVVNKIDLPARLDTELIRRAVPHVVTVSAQAGKGKEQLEAQVARLLGLTQFDPTAAIVATERQRACLQKAHETLLEALAVLRQGMTLDAVSVTIDCALDELLALTGQRASEAVIDEVFARFCVGK